MQCHQPRQALPKAKTLPGVQSGLSSAKGADTAAGNISVLSYAQFSSIRAEVDCTLILQETPLK